MDCIMCQGNLEERLTTYSVEVDSILYVVRNVPTSVCRQCGAESFSHTVAQRLDEILDSMEIVAREGGKESVTADYTSNDVKKAA